MYSPQSKHPKKITNDLLKLTSYTPTCDKRSRSRSKNKNKSPNISKRISRSPHTQDRVRDDHGHGAAGPSDFDRDINSILTFRESARQSFIDHQQAAAIKTQRK